MSKYRQKESAGKALAQSKLKNATGLKQGLAKKGAYLKKAVDDLNQLMYLDELNQEKKDLFMAEYDAVVGDPLYKTLNITTPSPEDWYGGEGKFKRGNQDFSLGTIKDILLFKNFMSGGKIGANKNNNIIDMLMTEEDD